MASYIFRPPTIDEGPAGFGPLFARFKITKGISVVKLAGVYSQVRNLDENQIPTYDEYYQGGGNYVVTDAVRTALIAGGVGVDATTFTAI